MFQDYALSSYALTCALLKAGFLGRGAHAKVAFLEGDVADRARGTPLAQHEASVDAVWQLLEGYASEHLGFIMHGRTPLLLRRTFSGAEDEASQAAPAEPSTEEVDMFLSMMHRK